MNGTGDTSETVTASGLDPLIHLPARLRIAATLAALPVGDMLSLTRLQDMTELTPDSLITHLHGLGDAGYVRTEKPRSGAVTIVALTYAGRAALDRYAAALRSLSAGEDAGAPGPEVRVGDADRDAAAAALGEHFAQGRLTLDELDARLATALAATTQAEISQATWDLPDVTVRSASSRRRRSGRGHRPGPAASRRTPPRHRA
jgi:DNA-binding MarR family transcriptional regulator